jgi:hypothetical protein
VSKRKLVFRENGHIRARPFPPYNPGMSNVDPRRSRRSRFTVTLPHMLRERGEWMYLDGLVSN